MANYDATTWVDDDGSGTVGTIVTAARMNHIEAGVRDAAVDSKQRGSIANRPPASQAVMNWLWLDSDTGRMSYCDGQNWYDVSSGVTSFAPVLHVIGRNVDLTQQLGSNLYGDGRAQAGAQVFPRDRVLLMGQTDRTQNGIYAAGSITQRLARVADASQPAHFQQGALVPVDPRSASPFAGQSIVYAGSSNPVVDTPPFAMQLAFSAPALARLAARVASTANVAIATPPATIDGVNLAAGDKVLLVGQTAANENGLYVYNGAGAALTRAVELATQQQFGQGLEIGVTSGATNAGASWIYSGVANPVITAGGAVTFLREGAAATGNPTRQQVYQAPAAGSAAAVTFPVAGGTDLGWRLLVNGRLDGGAANRYPYVRFNGVAPAWNTAIMQYVYMNATTPVSNQAVVKSATPGFGFILAGCEYSPANGDLTAELLIGALPGTDGFEWAGHSRFSWRTNAGNSNMEGGQVISAVEYGAGALGSPINITSLVLSWDGATFFGSVVLLPWQA